MKFVRSLLLALLLLVLTPAVAEAECHPIEITWYSPTGVAGCEVYGEGLASWWGGPGVARNDCLWPWTHCSPIKITSIATHRSVIVAPMMFCDCYTGTRNQRLVDLDPLTLQALGLWEIREQGLFPVVVEPVTTLPDTAIVRE